MAVKRIVPVGDFQLGEDERRAIMEVIEKGRISEAEQVRDFEKNFARYVGSKYCVLTSSGTAALLLGLLALKYDERFPAFRDGAKIVTSPVTYVATSNAVVLSNLVPVFADIDRRRFTLKPEKVEALLDEEGGAGVCGLLPVHLMGYPNDMGALNGIAKKRSLVVFEDSSQAHGTLVGEKKTGTLGMLSAFSFYIAHNIQAGEMGCVTTDDEVLARMMSQLKANGRQCDCPVCTRRQGFCKRLADEETDDVPDPRFTHEYVGFNFKVMEFQAALGNVQLRKAQEIFEKRQANVQYLNERLQPLEDILQLPEFDESVSYLAYPVVVREGSGWRRAEITRGLSAFGVENRPLFGCIPTQQPAYGHRKAEYEGKLPDAEFVGANGFYVGCHQYLEREDLDRMAKGFAKVLKRDA